MICDQCETVAHCTKHGCVPKQPAPVQELVQSGLDADCIASVVSQRYTTPPVAAQQDQDEFVCSTGLCHYKPAAHPAVPDAIGPNEDELPAYAAGWNDCRQAMLEMMQ